MKTRRNLSGIFFRVKKDKTGKFDNVVFEDLTDEQQDKMMDGRTVEWIKSLAKQLGNTINEIGNEFEISISNE